MHAKLLTYREPSLLFLLVRLVNITRQEGDVFVEANLLLEHVSGGSERLVGLHPGSVLTIYDIDANSSK